MKNRYDNILRTYNQDILRLCPYVPVLFTMGAYEIKKLNKQGGRVLEIGSGEGDSALPILELTDASVDLLDVSPEMHAVAKKKLSRFKKRTSFICADAFEYLQNQKPRDMIVSAWTIHNFEKKEREVFLRAIYQGLKPGGTFILLDKVYPTKGSKNLLKKQCERYSRYLPTKVAQAIIKHEEEDASTIYRMDEKIVVALLKKIGFDVTIVDRIERDVLLLARKSNRSN